MRFRRVTLTCYKVIRQTNDKSAVKKNFFNQTITRGNVGSSVYTVYVCSYTCEEWGKKRVRTRKRAENRNFEKYILYGFNKEVLYMVDCSGQIHSTDCQFNETFSSLFLLYTLLDHSVRS